MKNFRVSNSILTGLILLIFAFASCNKEGDGVNESLKKEPKIVPFFEVQKGDSISKSIWREKPIITNEDEITVLYSTYDEKKAKASGSSYTSPIEFITALALRDSRSGYSYPTWDPGNGVIYNVIPVDLNEGAGGRYIYLTYSKDPNTPVSRSYYDLHIHENSTSTDPGEFITGDPSLGQMVDLNDGAGGPYLYLSSYDNGVGYNRVVDIAIISGYSSSIQYTGAGGPWHKVYTDLNKGAGGRYIYLFYSLQPIM